MRTGASLDEFAAAINRVVAGWINYYGLFGRKQLSLLLLRRVNTYLTRWARRKYKRLRAYKRLRTWWSGLMDREPGLFIHWSRTRAYDW
jgi:RNA-directed DNA polymerase